MIPAHTDLLLRHTTTKERNNKWRQIWLLSEQLTDSAKDEMPCKVFSLSHTDAVKAAVLEQRADTLDWHRDRERRNVLDIELIL